MRCTSSLLAFAIALLLAQFANAGVFDEAGYCTNRELHASSTKTISLQQGVRAKPAFYLRDSGPDRVLFFRPEDAVAVLEQEISELLDAGSMMQASSLKRLLDLIRADLPLKEDTDLFKYVLRDGEFASSLDHYVASLLDRGFAAVDIAPLHMPGEGDVQSNDQFDPAVIKRVHRTIRGQASERAYCDTKGYIFFSVVDPATRP